MARPRVLYIAYWGALEPLGQALLVPAVLALAARGARVTLLSYEKPSDAHPRAIAALRARLRRGGVRWIAGRYHHRPQAPATMLDLVQGALRILAKPGWRRYDIVHGRTLVGGALGAALAPLLGARFIFHTEGYWARERVDAGTWAANSPAYRVADGLEQCLFDRADAIFCLTEASRAELELRPAVARQRTPVVSVPSAVDLDFFYREATDRSVVATSADFDGDGGAMAESRRAVDRIRLNATKATPTIVAPTTVAPTTVAPATVAPAMADPKFAEKTTPPGRQGAGKTILLVYAGTVGGAGVGDRKAPAEPGISHRYRLDLMAGFVAHGRRTGRRVHLEVLTRAPAALVAEIVAAAGLPPEGYCCRMTDRAGVRAALAQSDGGLLFQAPGAAAHAGSPTKVGEYWAMGLPVLLTRGIGDTTTIASAFEAGVLVTGHAAADWERAWLQLEAMLADASTAARCRAAAAAHYDLGQGTLRQWEVYRQLLGWPEA